MKMFPSARAFAAAIVLAGPALQALHAQEMPGMSMPAPAPPKANHTPTKPDPAVTDPQRTEPSKAKSRAAAPGGKQSSAQHAPTQQAAPPAASSSDTSDRRSLEESFDVLQEPEAAGFHTGADVPAPELLGEVAGRAPMTVDQFLHLADESNPTLAEAQRNVERSQQQARQAGLPPDPTVGYSGDHIRGGSYHGGEQGAFFSQEFVLGRKLALRRDVYRAEGRSNELAVEVQRARVHGDVARAFFDALTAQEEVVIEDRLLKVALDAQKNAHELERVGQADAADVLNAEIAAEQAKIEFVQAQRMYLGAFSRLATLAGQAALVPHPLSGSLSEPPELDPEALVGRDVRESPAVKQAEANTATAEARSKSAKRERVPDLNVKAGEWYSGEELGATSGRAGFESFAEVGVQIPLWNRNQGNTAAAEVEVQRAQAEVLRARLLTQHRAEPLAQQYSSARFTAERYRTEMLPRARRAYELQVTKYQQMALDYTHVLAAQRMLFTLQLAYIRALQEEWTAALALENYALTDGLDLPPSVGENDTMRNTPAGAR